MSRIRRPWSTLLIFALATIVSLLLNSVVPHTIPRGLGVAFADSFTGAAATPNPIAAQAVPQHPFMASDGTNSMHNDAYATDAYRTPGPLGHKTKVTSATSGLEECATLAFDGTGRLLGLCGDIIGPELKLLDPVSLALIASFPLPGRELREGVAPWEDLCGGAYFYVNNLGQAVVATTNREVRVISVSGAKLSQSRVFELSSLVPPEDCLIALMPDWAGRIWFVTSGGRVGAIDPQTGAAQAVYLEGERIANSIASDETGGVFVVSDHALYRFAASATGLPEVTWRQVYDRGVRHKPGQLSWGSGTTPTLSGDRLVAITDNAEPRMNVVVYDRHSGDVVCQEPVFEPGASATDNSLIALGNAFVVENNYGYAGPLSTLFKGASSPGVARIDVNEYGCSTAWVSDVIAPSCVPKASLATGLIYVYAKDPGPLMGAWYFTAIDARTGQTVFRVLTGTGSGWNNHYAAITLGPDGTAYIGTLFGIVRISG
jgi:hypothetical protein